MDKNAKYQPSSVSFSPDGEVKRLVLLHAFKKKGRKTPKLEIKIAAKRRDLVQANEEDRNEDEK